VLTGGLFSSRPTLIHPCTAAGGSPVPPEGPCQQLGVPAHCIAVELKYGLTGPLNSLLYSDDSRITDRVDLSLSGCDFSSKFSNMRPFCWANGCASELSRAPELRMPLHRSYSESIPANKARNRHARCCVPNFHFASPKGYELASVPDVAMDKSEVLARLAQDKPPFHYMDEAAVHRAAPAGYTSGWVRSALASALRFCVGSPTV
jgi:hypothetical protein